MAGKKIVVITGANTGIGLETVKSLLRSKNKYHIWLGGRDLRKAQDAAHASSSSLLSSALDSRTSSSVEPFQVDVESDLSIENAYRRISIESPRIDCLVNNAGASFDAHIRQDKITARAAWNKTWAVNVTGSHLMTTTFLPLLVKSRDPRLLFLTSGLSSLAEASDLGDSKNAAPRSGVPEYFPSYRASKTGLNMMMLDWHKALVNNNVKVWSVAPGFLATSLGGDTEYLKRLGAGDPSTGGEFVRKVIEGERDEDVGKVVRGYKSSIQPW